MQIAQQETVINTPFSRTYPDGLAGYIHSVENTYVQLDYLGEKIEDRKRFNTLMRSLLIPGYTDWMVSHCKTNFKARFDSFAQSCRWLRSKHAQLENYNRDAARRKAKLVKTDTNTSTILQAVLSIVQANALHNGHMEIPYALWKVLRPET